MQPPCVSPTWFTSGPCDVALFGSPLSHIPCFLAHPLSFLAAPPPPALCYKRKREKTLPRRRIPGLPFTAAQKSRAFDHLLSFEFKKLILPGRPPLNQSQHKPKTNNNLTSNHLSLIITQQLNFNWFIPPWFFTSKGSTPHVAHQFKTNKTMPRILSTPLFLYFPRLCTTSQVFNNF